MPGSTRTTTVPVARPFVYHFRNWNLFYLRALRYHETRHPTRTLVSERIATFRSYMTKDVLQLLGTLMAPHPRYDTEHGWDEWVACVRTALKNYDNTVDHPVVAEAAVALYTEGKVDEVTLWRWLDRLVYEGHLSSSEQRMHFWLALSPTTSKMLARCNPCFDPQHEVWRNSGKGESGEGEEAFTAVQKLNRLIELLHARTLVKKARRQVQTSASMTKFQAGLFVVVLLLDLFLAIFYPPFLAMTSVLSTLRLVVMLVLPILIFLGTLASLGPLRDSVSCRDAHEDTWQRLLRIERENASNCFSISGSAAPRVL